MSDSPTRFSFRVPGRPQPKQRPRVVDGHAYTPDETDAYESRVAELAALHRPGSWPTDRRYECRVRAVYPDGVVADLDNVLKAILDGLTDVAWDDDDQVVRLFAERHDDRPVGEGWVDVEVRHFHDLQSRFLDGDAD